MVTRKNDERAPLATGQDTSRRLSSPHSRDVRKTFRSSKASSGNYVAWEGYTPVLEMAQLKLKLPKEALAALTGLREPGMAWHRPGRNVREQRDSHHVSS